MSQPMDRSKDVRERQDQVDHPRRNRALGHSVEFGLIWILNDDEPAFALISRTPRVPSQPVPVNTTPTE
jgi:hypothetical protein